jgi:hypothetical protein
MRGPVVPQTRGNRTFWPQRNAVSGYAPSCMTAAVGQRRRVVDQVPSEQPTRLTEQAEHPLQTRAAASTAARAGEMFAAAG